MATMEFSNINNFHAHILYVDYNTWDKQRITKFNQTFGQIKYQEDGKERKTTFISRIEKCRSIASFMNYIKKDPIIYIATDFKTILSLEYYTREWFFDSTSTPKYLQQNTTKYATENEMKQKLIYFFMKKFHSGITEYDHIMRDKEIIKFLHLTTFQQIYKNCFTQFCPKYVIQYINTHTKYV